MPLSSNYCRRPQISILPYLLLSVKAKRYVRILRVNSSKNVTEEGSFTHLEMLPAKCRLLSLCSIGGLGVFPELFHSLVDGSS